MKLNNLCPCHVVGIPW